MIAAVGALLVALVAGLFSLTGLVISKEQKTSEFRQAWIDALRQDATQISASLEAWATANNTPEMAEANHAYRTSVTAARLRLNIEEDAPKAVFAVFDHMDSLIATGNRDVSHVRATLDRFVAAMQPVLKLEWEVVKLGEGGFRNARAAGTALMIGAGVLFLALILTPIFCPDLGREKKAAEQSGSPIPQAAADPPLVPAA